MSGAPLAQNTQAEGNNLGETQRRSSKSTLLGGGGKKNPDCFITVLLIKCALLA